MCSTSAYSAQNGVGNIFGSGLLRTTSLIRRTDGPARFHLIAARRSARRKRALLLTPLVIGALVLAVGPGREAISRVSREKIIAALKDPLSLFADRSPGARRPGALLASKKGGPRERVLSTVRDRPQAGDGPPAADNPIFAAAPPAFESSSDSPPPGVPPASGPPFSGTPFLFPGPPRGAPPSGIPPEGVPPGGIPPGGTPPGETPPGGIPPGGPPPGGPPPGEPPPGGPPGTPPIPIPEPATWTMMLLGLLAAGAVARAARRSR